MQIVLDKNKKRTGYVLEQDEIFISFRFETHPRLVKIPLKELNSKGSAFELLDKNKKAS